MTRNERELALLLAAAAQRIDELENDPPSPTEEVLLREKVEKLGRDLEMCRARINTLLADRDGCRDEIARLRLQIAELGGSADGR